MKPFDAGALLLAAIFLLAGVIWPHMAGALLRGFVLTLVLLWVSLRALAAGLPSARTLDRYAPFDGAGDRVERVLPDGLWDLVQEVRNADDPERSRRSIVSPAVRGLLQEDAARRLAEGYGLNLLDPAHHPRIRTRLSGDTWRLIAPTGAEGAAPRVAAAHDAVTLGQLDPILDELEML